jgi:hypothetical protein
LFLYLFAAVEESTKEIVKRAAAAVGSLKETEFVVRFNPDVYSPGVKHVDSPDAPDSIRKQRQLVKDAAEFLVTSQIPSFVCLYFIVLLRIFLLSSIHLVLILQVII